MRTRDINNKDLAGTNIKVVRSKGKTYYYYKVSDTKVLSLKSDREAAIAAAHILNDRLNRHADLVQSALHQLNTPKPSPTILINTPNTMSKLIREYLDLVLIPASKKKLAKIQQQPHQQGKKATDKTLQEKKYKLNKYLELWHAQPCDQLTTQTIAGFLNDLSDNPYIKHRALLEDLFSFAIHQGYRTDNPVTVTRTKNEPDRQRLRHTLEGYNTIYKVAPQWLRNAMDIALRSLQRRADIVSLQRDQVDLSTNTIKVLQEKTRTYTKPIYIEIEMGPELREAVERCLNSGIDCPYLIHTRPERITKQVRDSKPHLYAVTEDHLTKQFKYYRDLSSAYDHIPANIRPTFHDLRALGVWLYQQEGFHDEYIMALSGHVEIQTLERYKAGHSVPKPKKVSANLTLDRNPKKKT